jgi:TatD DNase family protein
MLIDAHAHLDKYGAELDTALAEIEQNRIVTWAVSMDLASYRRTREIALRCDLVLPTFGVHPKMAPEYADRLGELSPWIERSPAIGEIGLDFHWVEDASQYPAQLKVLEYFLAAAGEQKKIVNLHTKGAEKEILNLLERYDIKRPIIHWYSGPLDILRALAEFGAYFTVGVEILYSQTIRELARKVPMNRLLTESDNPGGLKWLNGTIGMPRIIREVIASLATVKQTTPEVVEAAVEDNFLRLIDGDPRLAAFRIGRLSNADG